MTALPTIDITRDVPTVARSGWDAFVRHNDPLRFFLRGDEMVEFVQHGDRSMLSPVLYPRFLHALRRVAVWDKNGADHGPPKDVAQDMFAEPRKPLPFIERVHHAPVFVPPGVLLSETGYHPLSRSHIALDRDVRTPSIPLSPTSADVRRAVGLLTEDLLVDFPFVAARDKAHALALALLPFLRPLIQGPTPLHLVRKPMPGAGGSLLTQVLLAPAVGRAKFMSEAKGNEEWRKRLTATLRGLPVYVWIDNLGDRLDSVALSAVLSGELTGDRIMGTSDEVVLPIHCAWVAAANNPTLSDEIARRTVPISIDPRVERPQEREGFKHPLPGWAHANRSRLIEAACVMVQAWIAAGMPSAPSVKPLGTFEAWSEVMGGVLDVCGIEGFLEDQASFYVRHDDEGDAMRRFVALWFSTFGEAPVGVSGLLPLATQIGELGVLPGDHGSSIKLGRRLRREIDRVYSGVRVLHGGTSGHAKQYKLSRELSNSASTPPPQATDQSQLRALP